MSNVMDNRCPSCSAPIVYKPSLGKFKCDYCESEFAAHELKTAADSTVDVSQGHEYSSYNCPDCGAQIIADETTSATFCLYCGNSSILKNKLSGEFKPDLIMPFRQDREHAVEVFVGLKKGRPFMPPFFSDKKNIEKITGLYIPFWLYDLNIDSLIEVKAVNVTHWSGGDTHYTKTDVYNVTRGGIFAFTKIPVDGSTKFNDDIMSSLEPFDYEKLEEFNPAYLSGFLAEMYDVDKDAAYPNAKSRVENSAEEQLINDIRYGSPMVNKRDHKVMIESCKYALLPVWMVNVKFQDKYYLFAMNGQTGEIIGDIPLDKGKVVYYTIVIFITIFSTLMVLTFIVYLLGGSV